ncbi:hypothetical protein ACMFMG_009107 [Clarireedia jacksonii]
MCDHSSPSSRNMIFVARWCSKFSNGNSSISTYDNHLTKNVVIATNEKVAPHRQWFPLQDSRCSRRQALGAKRRGGSTWCVSGGTAHWVVDLKVGVQTGLVCIGMMLMDIWFCKWEFAI